MTSRRTKRSVSGLPAEQRRAIRGWCMYDWANSSFATSISTAILPVYFVALFKDSFGPETEFLGLTLTGSSLWSLGVAGSTAMVALSSPVLGIIADRTMIKKTLLWVYTLAGALFTVALFFSAYTGAAWAWVLGCFVIANIGFAGGTVFYNSFLPHLAPRDLLDDVSSRGFAFGYIGGGLLLAAHLLALVAFGETDHADLVARMAIGSVGIWWFGWALWTFRTVPEPLIPGRVRGLTAPGAVRMAFSELGRTFRELTRYRVLVVYLVAYLLFNDGIQTVLAVAGAFGADTLGISLQFNMATILIIQLIAAPGAVVFGRLAGPNRTRTTLMAALAGWCLAIAFGVGLAPLEPRDHGDFDYRLQYGVAGSYEVSAAPELSDSPGDRDWRERHGELESGDEVSRSEAASLAAHVADVEGSRFSISIRGGPLDGVRETGLHHPSNLTRGPIDWWPRALRQAAWEPLGISADYQWLILGSVVGIVLGGSQALARSLFAYMTPESRSAEFFGFFGFVSRASAVFGPMVYLLFTGLYDTRVAILLVLVLILAGTIALGRVDVAAGGAVAAAEDIHRKPAAPSGGEVSE